MNAPSRLLERETKFSAAPALTLPDLRGLVDTTRLAEQHLRATYFDTADLRLWRQGITLRHRVGEGPDQGLWTLKLPSDVSGITLERTELSWPGAREVVPPEVSAIVMGLVRHAELRPLFDLATTRQRLVLHDHNGVRLAELDDDLVTVGGGPNDGLRFRQLELELVEGAQGADQAKTIDAVARALTAAGAQVGDGAKFAKALGVEAAALRPTGALKKRARMADVVRASVGDGLARLLAHDYLLRVDPADPQVEDVHQARVASRRLRSDLKTLRDVLDPVWNDHMRADLRWLGNLLGEVRDLDELRQGFGSAEADEAGTGLSEIDGVLCAQRGRAVAALHAGLESPRYLRLLDRLDAASVSPPLVAAAPGRSHVVVRPGQRARRALPHVVAVPWRSLRKRVRKAGRNPSDTQLHKIRIGAKQLRYASELAGPVVGPQARRTARRAERLQTVLGEHHDAVFAEAWLRRETAALSPTGILEAGRLIEVQRQRQEEFRRVWRHQWKALAKKKGRRWLKG
jgi:CHAD domain-containing protein